VIIVDADKLEDVLLNEVGKHGVSDLIVALEEVGALRTVDENNAVVTVEQAERWAGRSLTPGDTEWLKRAIPKSSVAQDIGTIAHSLTLPDALISDTTGREGRDISDSRYDYIVACDYFPAILSELYAAATDQEVGVLDAIAIRSGLIWCCDCGRRNPHWFDSCAVAH
jgi:hypothetical protein